MNPTELDLLYYFIQTKPEAVARLIEQFEPEKLITLFKKLPWERTSNLFNVLLPPIQAMVIAHLDEKSLRLFCSTLSNNHLAIVLRHCDENTKKQIFQTLTPKQTLAIENLLHYPETTIGAWMSPPGVQISADYKCQNAYRKIAHSANEHGWFMVVDRARQLVGKIHIETLFQERHSNQSIKKLVQEISLMLPAKLSVFQAVNNPCWQTNDWVPLVDRHGWFVGTLNNQQLKHAINVLQQRESSIPIPITAEFSKWYSENLVEFMKILLSNLLKTKIQS